MPDPGRLRKGRGKSLKALVVTFLSLTHWRLEAGSRTHIASGDALLFWLRNEKGSS